jgi:rod shape-determining protein MreD
MANVLKIPLLIITALLLQVTIFPAYLADPFKPNLLIIAVAYMGLKTFRLGGGAFCLGLVQDCFSGIYLGLSGFSFLGIYLLLNMTAGRVYTDNRFLMVIVVFLATVVNGLLHLLLLLIFSTANGIYATLLPSIVPQGMVNALLTSLLFGFPAFKVLEESR